MGLFFFIPGAIKRSRETLYCFTNRAMRHPFFEFTKRAAPKKRRREGRAADCVASSQGEVGNDSALTGAGVADFNCCNSTSTCLQTLGFRLVALGALGSA